MSLSRLSAVDELVDLARQQPEYETHVTGILERLGYVLEKGWIGLDDDEDLLMKEDGGTLETVEEVEQATLTKIEKKGGRISSLLMKTINEGLRELDRMDGSGEDETEEENASEGRKAE